MRFLLDLTRIIKYKRGMNLNPTAQEIRSAFQALEELKAAPYKAKSARLKILRGHHDNRALIQLFRVATDFKLPLHIHLDPTVECQNIEGNLEKNFEIFLHITEQCASGAATGMKARHSARRFLFELSATEAHWYHAAWRRDLGVGVQSGLLSEALNGFDNVWGISRVSEYAESESVAAAFHDRYPVVLEPRLDSSTSMRLNFICSNGHVIAYSERMREYPIAIDAFSKQILRALDGKDGVIEAIVTAKDWNGTFSLLSQKLKSLRKADFKEAYYSMRLILTDVTTLDIFSTRLKQEDTTPAFGRRNQLEALVGAIRKRSRNGSIQIIPQRIVNSGSELRSITREWAEQGFTRVIARTHDEPYVARKEISKSCWKIGDCVRGEIVGGQVTGEDRSHASIQVKLDHAIDPIEVQLNPPDSEAYHSNADRMQGLRVALKRQNVRFHLGTHRHLYSLANPLEIPTKEANG